MRIYHYITICMIAVAVSCGGGNANAVECGAEQLNRYLPLLEGKSVGLIVNQTSRVAESHLVDTLISCGVDIKRIFAPEHGFRGDADAGEHVEDGVDLRSGVKIVSLYGSNRRPSAEQLEGIDVMIYDIQDVGVRFYTYISTLYYMMQACSTHNIEMIVLDRPNPCDYVDGPIITPDLQSFIGAMPIPILYGLTCGELAELINGEGWAGERGVKLAVIPIKKWRHGDPYSLPVKPSPNLPNDQSIALYPSLCLFEATEVSVGRGTYSPFQIVGYPDPKFGEYTFTPQPLVGFDKNPLQNGKLCYGVDLRETEAPKGFSLQYFIAFMERSALGAKFITRGSMFDKLCGDAELKEQLAEGWSEERIRATWTEDLDKYHTMRAKYLLYKDYK